MFRLFLEQAPSFSEVLHIAFTKKPPLGGFLYFIIYFGILILLWQELISYFIF